jgi:DNA-binding transcriptional ArsR family regulator
MKDFTKAFSSPIRVRILSCLLDGKKNVSGLIDNCQLSQSAVSQHLKKLKNIGVINCSSLGRERFYSLTKKDFGLIAKKMLPFISSHPCFKIIK